jgi:hypothetical protein
MPVNTLMMFVAVIPPMPGIMGFDMPSLIYICQLSTLRSCIPGTQAILSCFNNRNSF